MRGTLRAASVLGSTLLIVAVSCGTHVELGGTYKDPLGGAPNDAASGTGGIGGSDGSGGFSGTDGSGGSGEFDAGFDAPMDVDPPPDGRRICQLQQLFTAVVVTQEACEVVLPQPWTSLATPIVFLGVNVTYRPPMGEDRIIGYVDSAEDCANVEEGWYLVEPLRPRLIVLCPEVCAEIEAEGGRLRLALGCERVPAPTR